MKKDHNKGTRITTACLLAAGNGSRMHPLTSSMPKCLTEINGIPILKQLVDCLHRHGFKRLVVVVGHHEHSIRKFLPEHGGSLTIDYVTNSLYKTTNNIYSLWLARDKIQEPFILIESDLIFDASLFGDLLHPNKIAISHVRPWMNGTMITMDSQRQVSAFWADEATDLDDILYKTVNIYSLSHSSWQKVVERLEKHISSGRVNDYYEVVFADMIADGSLDFECVFFDVECWYEIDTLDDLYEAEQISWETNEVFHNQPLVCHDAH